MPADERVPSRMTPDEARQALDDLGLTIDQAARLLRVTTRTMRRYFDGDSEEGEGGSIPGAVEQALRAWTALNERGLPWRPDALPLTTLAPESLARLNMRRQHVAECIARVRKAGGPTLPWDVDVNWGVARLGSMSLYFYLLPSGGFVPQSYMRQDKAPDLERDKAMLEDGVASIAQWLEDSGIALEPVPALSKAQRYAGAYLMWEDDSPPRYVVRILAEHVAALAKADVSDEAACRRFLKESAGEIAKIADVQFYLQDHPAPELGIQVIDLGEGDLAPGRLHRTERVQVIGAGSKDGLPSKKTRRVLLVGSKDCLPPIPPILGEE